MIKALHLFANHKVTGPAELALDTALALEKSRSDWECHFLPAHHPKDPSWLKDLAKEKMARLVEVEGLRLQKHYNPIRAHLDSRILARYLDHHPVDLIHCHLPNDHLVAGAALAARKRNRHPIPIIRTVYDGEPLKPNWRNKKSLTKNCTGAICFTRTVQQQLQNGLWSLPEDRVRLVDPPIDTDLFSPPTMEDQNRYREEMGLPKDAYVVGIVARMQTHRRFGPLLEAVRIVADHIPQFRFVIIGRGTHQDKVARDPVRKLGLEKIVLFAGYRLGENYRTALQTFDVKVFLVPGSDGTCRAVREALASGIPVVSSQRGILPTLIEDGKTGRVIEDTPDNIAKVLIDISSSPEQLAEMKKASRRNAKKRFSFQNYVSAIFDLWERSL